MAATFTYKVRDSSGKVIGGTLEADSVSAVVAKLRQMNYTVVEVNEKRSGGLSMDISLPGGGRVKSKDLAVFSRQFATMINAGLSLTKCLSILGAQTTNKTLGNAITEIEHDVEGGLALSDALGKFPKIFPPLFSNMVRAGETGGVLDTVLLRIADYLEKENQLRAKIKSAMMYPIVIFVACMGLVFAMITFIVPVFANMFATLGGELPLPTQMLVYASDAVKGYWWLMIITVIGMFFGYRAFIGTDFGRLFMDKLKLRLPLVGGLIEKSAVARFSRTLGTLVSSGVPIIQALTIVAATSGNLVLGNAIRKAHGSIQGGTSIAAPLEESQVFPPMVIQMISVGEETGALDTMLEKIADFYDEEVGTAVEGITSIIEPIMVIFMGVVVGGIMISLYLPMFKIASLIK